MKNNDPLKPNHLVVMDTMTDKESLDAMALPEWETFNKQLHRYSIPLDTFALWVNEYPVTDAIERNFINQPHHRNALEQSVAPAYERFREAFREITGVGIRIDYHDSKRNGAPFDDVDGVLFVLDEQDLYIPTKNARELNKHLRFAARAHYIKQSDGDE